MSLTTILMVVGIIFAIMIIGKILSHSLKFILYALLILLVVVFVFGVSLTAFLNFIRNLIFATF